MILEYNIDTKERHLDVAISADSTPKEVFEFFNKRWKDLGEPHALIQIMVGDYVVVNGWTITVSDGITFEHIGRFIMGDRFVW